MIEENTGKIVHIDFGDCFEVTKYREKFPEKIPFRLTNMLINALELSGIEGTFRITCESVMNVIKESNESLMAMLEAFVYDPLLQWRLVVDNDNENKNNENYDKNNDLTNFRALEVMERISNKLNGRDFDYNEKLNTPDQVNKLIEEATLNINLCQCFYGWCPFW
jgi:FKBP12-rapamycin complex-associated protein